MDGTIRVKTAVWFATAVVISVFATLLVSQEWRADAAPGDADSTFVPTAGCRVTDTRATSTVGPRNTPLGADQSFTVAIHGSNGECTGALAIPTDAVAVALNVTAVNATASSNIRIFPANLTTVPLLSNLNVSAGAPPTPNKVDVELSPDGNIKVYNFNGSVNIVIDIVGYYTNSTLKELAARVAASEAKIAVLEASEPFAVSNYTGPSVGLTLIPTSVVDVMVTAPVDGQVTVNYSTYVNISIAAAEVRCAPFRSTEMPDAEILNTDHGVGWWKTSVTNVGGQGSVSGTARFDIAAGTTVTYSLACDERNGQGSVRGRTMTAIFTPTP
jgi:hypothetical protein